MENPQTEIKGALQKYAGRFECPLKRKLMISGDSYVFTFELPDPDLPLGLGVGEHIVIHAFLPTPFMPTGEDVRRKYTPTSKITQKGTFDLVVKIYRKGEHPVFPNGGIMTPYLESLNLGDKITISGPTGKFKYRGQGTIYRKKINNESQYKELGLICGGSGLAPMFQIIQAIFDDKSDNTKVHLLFANRSEADILLKEELDEFVEDPRFKVHYTVDKAGKSWNGFVGYITKEMIAQTMPAPHKEVLISCCGNKPMNKLIRSLCYEIGHDVINVHKF